MSGDDDQLFAVLDDLERRAAAAFAAEREWEIADVARADYASVSLASRLMASLGSPVLIDVRGLGPLSGTLTHLGPDWLLLGAPRTSWLVLTAAVMTVSGASPRSRHEDSWELRHRLGVRAVLDRLCEQGSALLVHLEDGTRRHLVLRRIGADFVEAVEREATEQEHSILLASRMIAAIRLDSTTELA